ncbi:putative vesicle transport protein, Use1 [Helianthus annuus]|nr:putative vesicle transport protein, Use1 [Helianthus annuus]
MGLSKTEINFRRLLAAAPQQHHQSKLIHYVSTLRELLEQLAAERTPEGLPRISKATLSDYSEKMEAIAANLASSETGPPSTVEDRSQNTDGATDSAAIKLDAAAHGPYYKAQVSEYHFGYRNRKLQEDLTDEMVGLARQLKESTLMMNQSIKNIEKILDSTEEAVERSLARGDCTNAWESNVGILVLLLGFFLWHLLL